MRRQLFISTALALMTIWALPCPASIVWRPGEGWSDESSGQVSASSSGEQLDTARKLEAAGKRDDAFKAYKELLRRWPLSLSSPEAQYRIGKILEEEADFMGAFKAFQKMIEKYPSSSFFTQALEEQYRIANLYLAGEPQRIWKIPIAPSMEKTVELYQQVIKNAPYGPYAAQCQFNIGLADEKQRKYTDAVEAYQLVIERYGGSELSSNAQYQIGYAWMRSSSQADYDQSAAQKAIDAFQDYIVRYPDSDKVAQAQENIQKLSHRQTQGAYDIALFYERQHPPNPRAAFIYYNEVVREDPDSQQAALAKKRIQELRPTVDALTAASNPPSSTVASSSTTPNIPATVPDPGPGPVPNETPAPAPDPNSPGASSLPDSSTPAAPATNAVPATPATDAPPNTSTTPAGSNPGTATPPTPGTAPEKSALPQQ